MNTEPSNPTTAKPKSKHTRKRTNAQREADLVFIERLHIRGSNHATIADMLSKERGYTISRQQIAYDLKSLLDRWREESEGLAAQEMKRAYRSLMAQEEAAWEGWRNSGDPAFLKITRDLHDRRMRLSGIDRSAILATQAMPTKSESSFTGTLSDELVQMVIDRHYDRQLQSERAKYAEMHGVGLHDVEMIPRQFIIRGQSPAVE